MSDDQLATALPLRTAAAHLFCMTNIALGLPLFDVLGDGANFFVAHRSGPAEILVLVAVLCLLAPAALLLVEILAGAFGARARSGTHLLIMDALVFLYALRVLNAVAEPTPGWAFAGAAALAAAGSAAYALQPGVRSFLTFASPACLLIPGLFLFTSPVSGIVGGGRAADASRVELASTPPIVIVIFDELPLVSLLDARGEIDGLRLPNFARLAASSYWFRQATTVSDNTPGAITAIVAGKLDSEREISSYRAHPDTLFALLRDHYAFNVWETVTELLPPELHEADERGATAPRRRPIGLLPDVAVVYLHLVTPVALRSNLPSLDGRWGGFRADGSAAPAARGTPLESIPRGSESADADTDVLEPLSLPRPFTVLQAKTFLQERIGIVERNRARLRERRERELDSAQLEGDRGRIFGEFVSSIRPSDRPTLHFHHTMLPHTPWAHLPSGRAYNSPPGKPIRRWKRNSSGGKGKAALHRNPISIDAVIRRHQMHLLQTAYVDRLLGELLNHLEREELLEESLLIVTADHGAAFVPGDFARAPSAANLGEIMFVPLFIKLPGQRNGIEMALNAQSIDILPSIAEVLGAKLPWPRPGVSLFDPAPERPFKVIYSADMSHQEVRAEDALASLASAITRNADRFDLDRIGDAIFRVGNFREVLGRPVEAFEFVDAPLPAEIDQAEQLRDVRPNDRVLPAWVTGRIPIARGFLHTDMHSGNVAVALNGVIRATAPLELREGSGHFSVLLPEEGFREGANTLEVFFVARDESGAVRLRGL